MGDIDSTSSNYEKLRQENIKRNSDFLDSIGITGVKIRAPQSQSVRPAIQKKKTQKRKLATDLPLRRSPRISLDIMPEQTSLDSASIKADDLTQWKQVFSESLLKYNSEKPLNPFPEDSCAMSDLRINVFGMEKVVSSAVTCIAFHPSVDKCIVFAGDKHGNLGVWNAPPNYKEEKEGEEAEGGDGEEEEDTIFAYKPHSGNISALHIPLRDSHQLYSSSYDGTIRCMDIHRAQFVSAYSGGGTIRHAAFPEYSVCHTPSSTNSVYTAEDGGYISLVDFRAKSGESSGATWSHRAHEKNIHSISRHPSDDHILVATTAGKTSMIVAYDIRKAGDSWESVVELTEHTKSINGARISPDGKYLVSVSQDDTLKVWTNFLDQEDHSCVSIYHFNNNEGNRRFVNTVLPTFDMKQQSSFAMGSMEHPRRIEIYDLGREDTDSLLSGKLDSGIKKEEEETDEGATVLSAPSLLMNEDWLTTICSRVCFHPTRNIIAGGNSSGKIHIFR